MAIKINGATVISDSQAITSTSTISATGNITGGNVSVVGTIIAAGINTGSSPMSTTGNVTGGNILTSGLISATGNITGSYIFGNGSQLSGIDATQIVSGTSNAKVVSSGGNISVSVGGTPNVAVFATTGEYVTGLISATGTITGANITGANILTAGLVSATGTITGANITGANILTGGIMSSTGNATHGNILTGGLISATATITGGNIATGGTISGTGNITGGNVNTGGNVSGNWLLPTTGMSTGGNVLVGGYISVVGNLYVANIVSSQTLTVDDPLLYLTANVPYPYNYAIGFYSAFTGGTGNTYQHTGIVRDYTDNTWKVVSNVPEPSGSSVNFTNAIYDAIKMGNITSTGFISATGTVTGTAHNGTSVSVSGGVTAASVAGGVITGSSVSVSGSVTGGAYNGTSVSVSGSVTAASTVGGVITGSSASVTGAVSGASLVGTVTTAAQGSITSLGTLTGLTINNATTAINNGATSGSGNIGASGATFNTVFAKATTAQYADLAEKYVADAEYAPGTVLVFGGTHEVTVDAEDSDRKVAGVVSTDPGFLMNEGLATEFTAAIALTGRVPTFVVGPVKKGDLMVAAGLGRARSEADPKVGAVIGKALEDFDGTEGTIEVVVGRF